MLPGFNTLVALSMIRRLRGSVNADIILNVAQSGYFSYGVAALYCWNRFAQNSPKRTKDSPHCSIRSQTVMCGILAEPEPSRQGACCACFLALRTCSCLFAAATDGSEKNERIVPVLFLSGPQHFNAFNNAAVNKISRPGDVKAAYGPIVIAAIAEAKAFFAEVTHPAISRIQR